MHTENPQSHKPLGNSYAATTPSADPTPPPNIATRKSQAIPPIPPNHSSDNPPNPNTGNECSHPGQLHQIRKNLVGAPLVGALPPLPPRGHPISIRRGTPCGCPPPSWAPHIHP